MAIRSGFSGLTSAQSRRRGEGAQIDGLGYAPRDAGCHRTRGHNDVGHDTEVPPEDGRVWAGSAAGDEGGDDVVGVSVEVLASSVEDGGGSGIGVAGRDLHVPKRDASVEGGHYETGTEHVGVHGGQAWSHAYATSPGGLCGTSPANESAAGRVVQALPVPEVRWREDHRVEASRAPSGGPAHRRGRSCRRIGRRANVRTVTHPGPR
jgi:hypothetical protein